LRGRTRRKRVSDESTHTHFTWPGIQTASQTLLRASPLRGQKLGLLSRHVDVSWHREIGVSPGVEELPTENIC